MTPPDLYAGHVVSVLREICISYRSLTQFYVRSNKPENEISFQTRRRCRSECRGSALGCTTLPPPGCACACLRIPGSSSHAHVTSIDEPPRSLNTHKRLTVVGGGSLWWSSGRGMVPVVQKWTSPWAGRMIPGLEEWSLWWINGPCSAGMFPVLKE